ncbi:MAG: 5'-methylthioadenosine/S-adenosylhomocysteine nucleosidase [Rhizobiaceae bacterium]
MSAPDPLFVMAVEAEYGDHLRRRFTPHFTGVGPVEAGVSLAAELALRQAAGRPPSLIVSLGSAGSRVLAQTEVYQVASVSWRDVDASPLGIEKGRTPFLDIPKEIPLPLLVPGLPSARLSTGATIVSGRTYEAIDADMVDMETFAHLRAAMRFGVPLIGLRGISDGKDDLNHIDDWTEYLHVVDEKLAEAVDRLLQAI